MTRVYLDYAATTPVDPRVVVAINKILKGKYGNSMSIHCEGQRSVGEIEKARAGLASMIGAKAGEIVFTGSATEANNLAIKGVAGANKKTLRQAQGKHIIVSALEHDCVLESASWLAKRGFEVEVLPYGDDVEKLIRKETILVSIMQVNNETGEIMDIGKIGQVCRKHGVLFHTDAAQGFGKLFIDVNEMKVDLLTASSHKIYGPAGAAFLYVRKGVEIEPLLHGGGQEGGLRSSTVNVAAVVGFYEAAKIMAKEGKAEMEKFKRLRDYLVSGLKDYQLNGDIKTSIPNIINFSVTGVEGEALMLGLDARGIAVSTGSACSSKNLEPSHVLMAMGKSSEEAHGSIRVSLGRWTKKEDIDYFLKVLKAEVKRLKKISAVSNEK